MIECRKILIGLFTTFYEILRYTTIFFYRLSLLDAVYWNIHGIAFINLGQFD